MREREINRPHIKKEMQRHDLKLASLTKHELINRQQESEFVICRGEKQPNVSLMTSRGKKNPHPGRGQQQLPKPNTKTESQRLNPFSLKWLSSVNFI